MLLLRRLFLGGRARQRGSGSVGARARHVACVAPPAEAPAWDAHKQLMPVLGAHSDPGRVPVQRLMAATRGSHVRVTSRRRALCPSKFQDASFDRILFKFLNPNFKICR